MDCPADQILAGVPVTLERHHRSTAEFLVRIPGMALVAAFFGAMPFFSVGIFLERVSLAPYCIAFSCIVFLVLVWNDWKNIGSKEVRIDLQLRTVLITQHFPHQKHLRDSVLPFSDLLITRCWCRESESESSTFVIRLKLQKCVGTRPDIEGYLLHIEGAASDMGAERASAAVAAQIVSVTGIEYLDLQNSTDKRFAFWSNPAIRPTKHAGH